MVAACPNSRVIGVEVANATTYHLAIVNFYLQKGQLQVPPTSISPGKKEALLAHRTGAHAAGATGVTVWKIGDTHVNLVVLWSTPFNFDHHKNVLGIGFMRGEFKAEKSTYKDMYFAEKETWFKRRKFTQTSGETIEITDESRQFTARGNMGTSHRCEAKIELLPNTMDGVAECYKSVRYHMEV